MDSKPSIDIGVMENTEAVIGEAKYMSSRGYSKTKIKNERWEFFKSALNCSKPFSPYYLYSMLEDSKSA